MEWQRQDAKFFKVERQGQHDVFCVPAESGVDAVYAFAREHGLEVLRIDHGSLDDQPALRVKVMRKQPQEVRVQSKSQARRVSAQAAGKRITILMPDGRRYEEWTDTEGRLHRSAPTEVAGG